MKEERQMQIWNYIDGTMSAAERVAFDQQMTLDPELRHMVDQYRKLDDRLRSGVTLKAPDSLKANVLSRVALKPEVSLQKESFAGVRFILGTMVTLTLAMLVIIMAVQSGTSGEMHPVISKTIDILSFDFSVPSGITNMLPYSLILVSLVFLIWMDRLFQSGRRGTAYTF